jgi:hypothetical protein
MEMTKEYPCIAIYLKLAKVPCFSNYGLCFFSTKLENRRANGTGSAGDMGELAWVGQGSSGKRSWRVNMVQIMYTHVCKCKNDTC